MKELSEIEAMFVEDILTTHGEYVVDLMQESIIKNKLTITEDLIKSIEYKVEKKDNDFVLVISFLSYGRAAEIRHFKSKLLRRESKGARNQIKNLRRQNRKDKRFYFKNVYGSINRLLGRMSSEYSDTEIARLKGILDSRFNMTI